jgi:type VI protein secretion system component VasK
MSPMSQLHLSALNTGGLAGVGPGIAGGRSWIVAVGVVVLLAALAWWTLRPARRASHVELMRGRRAARDKTDQAEGPIDRTRRSHQ